MKEIEGRCLLARDRYGVWVVVLGWVVANLLGLAVIGVLDLFPYLKSIPGILVSSLLIGLPIGFAQWIALRRIAPVSILWGLTISAGLILGLVVGNSPILGGVLGSLDDESLLAMTTGSAIMGLLAGLVQWFFLWGHFSRSWVWPLSSAAGLGLATCLLLVTDLINQSGILSAILATLVYAIVTGLALSWLPASHGKIASHPANAA